jgi:RNA polymerase sigma-70 factor (ECF subfamily)
VETQLSKTATDADPVTPQVGDLEALDRLLARHASRVYRLARTVTRDDAAAERVVQRVFRTLGREANVPQDDDATARRILQITLDAARQTRPARPPDADVPVEAWLPAFTHDGRRAGDPGVLLADWSRDPDEALRSRETRAVLGRALERLPERYRVVLVLRDVEGLGSRDAAAILGEPVAEVMATLHRARMALREQLTQLFMG